MNKEEDRLSTINYRNSTMIEENRWKDKRSWKELKMRREFYNCKLP